ncbi:HlyD family type I secretion periplasmic adaptor subunit [Magnetovibrio sp. PR-2]|uniref:HlyD family type I secretion periplasmic adaptor subunit n=1 Tax=Magnetovibrio sp. PR-2 TaxID=3120356 RepID=UPI002FCDE391
MPDQAQPNPLDTLLTSHPVPTWRNAAWPVMALMLFGVVWANFSKLDEVAVAPGEVIPLGKSKVIQHLEGGIIQDLFIKEGDVVSEGQTLMQLDLGSGGANIQELQVRLDSELLTRARLHAEAEGLSTPDFPEDVSARVPDQAIAQRQAFDARKRQLSAGLAVLNELVKQRKLEVQELEARLRASRNNLGNARERLKISTDLLKDGLTSQVDHLNVQSEVETLIGELESIEAGIPRSRAAVSEAERRLLEDETRFRREAQDELNKTEQSIGRVSELLKKAEEQGVRAEIKSPIDGVIINLAYTAAGNVVKPGDPILEIVPTGENMVIESRLNPTDRGYVTEGQRAMVKITTYDFARYGGLEGEVTLVAADTSMDEDGLPYFRVIVRPEKSHLGSNPGLLPIMPGMEATIDIHTGQKTVMDYLIKPVLKLKHEAFRER